jgi:hypothetical protein
MDRLQGAPEALEFLKRFDFEPPSVSFDAAFKQSGRVPAGRRGAGPEGRRPGIGASRFGAGPQGG